VFGFWGIHKVSAPLPPIYRDCRRLLVHTKEVMRRYSSYHKYTVGTDLRQQAMAVLVCYEFAVGSCALLPIDDSELTTRQPAVRQFLKLEGENL